MADTTELAKYYRNRYNDEIRLQAMQMESRLQRLFRQETIHGHQEFFDQMGQAVWVDRGPRASIHQYDEIPLERRAISLRDKKFVAFFDKPDSRSMERDLQNTGAFRSSVMSGLAVLKDSTIMAALNGNAYRHDASTGQNTAVPFDTGQEIDKDIGAADSGLNTTKVRAAIEMLGESEVFVEENRLIGIASPAAINTLMGDTETKSGDFNSAKPLVDGVVNYWMGVNWVKSNAVPAGSGFTGSYAFIATADALIYGTDMDGMDFRLDVIPERQHGIQAAFYYACAASRMFENKVVRIECVHA